ncbi:MAG TPA: nuclear transport factor 2 family protein [Terracidiphilus sp.]|nr:nuclear transport factor 2 family protein [Terracidiphilus sp.]
MNRPVAILFAALIAVIAVPAIAQDQSSDAAARAEIRRGLDTYMRSIDTADPKLAATIWLTTPDASFINPVGHERGWDQIADEVIVKLMGQTFSQRHLTAATEPVIHVFGDAAVLEFDWDFVATLRSNNSPVHTTGRESQFYVRFPDKGWRLVHVHYSGPAVPPPSNGRF